MTLRETLGIAIGTTMAIGLLWAAGQPSTGAIVPGVWHYIAHLATFALFGAIWTVALPGLQAFAIAAGVAAFGFVHEPCSARLVGASSMLQMRSRLTPRTFWQRPKLDGGKETR